MRPSVSIVLPVLNGIKTLPALLDAFEIQDFPDTFELVALDSGSTDGSLDLLHRRADQVIEVQPGDFNHGSTRNLGIKATSGELIVLIVQDAQPADKNWLRELLQPFEEEPELAGLSARQLPRPETGRLARRMLGRWALSQNLSWRSHFSDPADYDRLPPMERFRASIFDNVCSCIRKAVWEEHPFPVVSIAEDLHWGRDILRAGGTLGFRPEARVLHSHERSISYEFRRTLLLHRELRRLFGLRTIPKLSALLRAIPATLADHRDCLRHGEGPENSLREVFRAWGLAIAWPLAQYLGGRVER